MRHIAKLSGVRYTYLNQIPTEYIFLICCNTLLLKTNKIIATNKSYPNSVLGIDACRENPDFAVLSVCLKLSVKHGFGAIGLLGELDDLLNVNSLT